MSNIQGLTQVKGSPILFTPINKHTQVKSGNKMFSAFEHNNHCLPNT